jgi:hypothetical protein
MTRRIMLAERRNSTSRGAGVQMRRRQRVRERWEKAGGEAEPVITLAAPPPRARPTALQTSRATLLRRLARTPTISRSVGLVR